MDYRKFSTRERYSPRLVAEAEVGRTDQKEGGPLKGNRSVRKNNVLQQKTIVCSARVVKIEQITEF